MKTQIDWKIVIAGITALTAIEICALLQGIDGTMFTLVIGLIGLAIGVAIPNPLAK